MAEGPGSSPGLVIPSKKPKVTKIVPDAVVAMQEPTAPVFIRKLRKAAVGTSCDIRLRVSVAGSPKPSLTWYHNDEILPPSDEQDSDGLWIRDCRTSDAGLYTCVATNELGEASCSAVLAVMDLGEDSETTEDETTEPQMETKEGPGRHQDKAGRRGPSGEGGGMMDYNPDASDRRATLPGAYDPVVERELRALGSRPPGLHLDPTNPARDQTASPSFPQPPPSTHKNSISAQDLDKPKPSDPQSVNSVVMTPKLARAGPKIFDKVLAFEERRASVDLPRFGRAASCESEKTKEEDRVLQGASQKRAAFKQRASSLEDKTSYSQRVQNYQSKFAEELQRIKRLVGKPSLKKAYSTEQLPQKERLTLGKVEPIPPQVVKKLEERERALNESLDEKTQPDPRGKPVDSTGKVSVTMETPPVHQLPGKPLPTATRTSLTRETLQTSQKHSFPVRDLGTDSRRSPSPNGKRLSPITVREPGSQYPPKPPRLSPSPTPSISPLMKRRKADALMANIPTILVEDEPMETERVRDGTRRKEGKGRKSRKGRSVQPRSSEEGSSDDQSADEEPAEGPRFQRILEDTTGSSGSEVTLRCVVTGSPPPTEPTQCGQPTSALEVSGATRPDEEEEEDQSPQEEAMELEDSNKRVHFKETPLFQVAPCDQTVTQGEDVIMSAKVAGQPKPMVYWLKDRVAVKTAGRFAVREIDGGGSEVRISSAQRSDAGVYVCKIINEYGSKQAECRLEVKAPAAQAALRITREVKDAAVRAGESAMFECHITGPPDVEVDWLSNGKLIQPALLNCKMHFDGKRCRLLLNSVHEDDSGTYTCKLSTAKEELTSNAALSVTPSKEPLFTRKLDVLEVIEGRTARFDCKVSGSPAPRVTWMHFETRVEEGDNIRILQEGGRHSLVIVHVSSDTEGFYTAVAQNVHGKSECTAELYMQEPRAAISSHMAKLEKMPSIPEEPEVLESEVEKRTMPDFVKPLDDVEAIEGKEALLKCKVSGLPYPTIAWYHNGKRIESSDERRMSQHRDVHSMVIRSACHAHGGVYKAVISNRMGKAACYAHLYVTDIVPDPPDGPPVIEAITGKTISLSWRRPKRIDTSFDTGSLLYVVQQQPLGSIQWSVVASNLRETSYTVTSLSKGVRYAFRVLTSTGKTLSKPSASTDLVQLLDRGPYLRKAPVILDKPDVVYVVENQPASITVTLNHVHAAVTWKRRGVVLASKLGMYEMSMPDDDQHTLKFQRIRSSDIGQLMVTASNQFGSDLCTPQLVMAVPPKFETIMEDVDVHVGEMSRLAVVVEGKPDPDILWYKDDVLLAESSHFTFVYDDPEYSLVVLNVHPEHSGVYTCTAKNLAGSNSCKAELTVLTERKEAVEPVEDEGAILRKMRRLTDYYDVHKEIGRGAFSYVKRVTQKKGKAEFAAKFISAGGRRKAGALREMELLSELDSDRILYFHDAFEKKSVVVLITELCHEELLERMAKKTAVREVEIRSSIQQLLEGLRYLHQKNIAHLDIKPENILMAAPGSDHIRICDFGNAAKLETSEQHYCKYGTPEYVAPEIVNQTPVSTATDIWPAGVVTYLCLTGVSPFAGENDRATALNIRNYNVAFEESMFADLCKEAKGFVIKLLVADHLRPTAVECLRHPWFKSPTNKSISTAMLKQVLSRRRWQRSLISYKSKMVMRSIPELLNESSSHVSIAVARHLKEGSPPPSSSSDSDADVDELPFIPMPLSMVFSGSRVSLNEITGEEDATAERKKEVEAAGEADEEKTKRAPLKKGSSVESDEAQTKARRATMRRGSSADSALLLHIDPEEGDAAKEAENNKSLKKAVSMELPNRSPSPGVAKLSQEDYALKLELMRQRLLRGGNVDKKMSGLRGPLFETLGMEDDRRTGSLDRNPRRSRAAGSTLARAASSESAAEDTPKTKVFRKSSSFTQGDSEPMPLHRRFGAPLEIPSAGNGEEKKLQEATSMSVLTEQTVEKTTMDQEKDEDEKNERTKDQKTVIPPRIVIEEEEEEKKSTASPEHPAVFAKVATDRSPPASTPSNRQPVLRSDIKDIDSEEVFEARFKKRESSLTRGLRKLTRNKSEEKSPVLNRKGGEEVYRPGPRGAPLEMVSKGLQEKSKSVQDLREEEKDVGFGLIGRFSLRAKKGEKVKEESSAGSKRVSWSVGRSKSLDTNTPEESSVSAMRRKFESKVAGISAKIRSQSEERKESQKVPDSPVLAMRHKFENKVSGITSKIRSQSEERKEGEEGKRTPLFTRHRHSQSEGRGLKGMGVPENQLAKQTGKAASKESIESTSSVPETDRRSRWDRWGLSRAKKDKTPSQSDLPASVPPEDGLSRSQQFLRSASDFAPVFHIKLKDHVLLEGEPVTLSCLPAGSPHPHITWTKDRKPLEGDERIKLMSHPDGRQLLAIVKSSRRDAGVYECVATNPIATITTSCTLSIACVPKRPGTPEVPQTYNNTALVLWKPADTKSPCSYTLERKTEGDSTWLTVATGVVDCYFNVTELPPGASFRFRVACVNKAGQGPYSSCSAAVSLDSTGGGAPPAVVVPAAPDAPSLPAPPSSSSCAAKTTEDAAEDASRTSSSPAVKPPPPFVLPKPQSPVNVVSPMTQTPPISPPPAVVTPTKPSSVPTYVPTTAAPVSFTPHVLQSSSLSPIGEGATTPTRGTPSGRTSTSLRQGVPQKPYTFLDEKARGRFGVVRECRENATGKIYMAKIISYSQENKQEVLQEYEILKSLHNEKIMALHEAYVTPRYLVLVAEYCTGKELLYSLIDRFRYSEDDVVGYLVQILQGVEYLHSRRILHLDLKPDNILVTNLNAVKIVDFGSAQVFSPLSLKQQETAGGTLEYMAPEMVKGEVVGPPADIWTVGVVTYIMLSGRLPFEDKDPLRVESKILMAKLDPTKLHPNVSQSASTFLKKMLSSYPWARPTTRDCFTHAWLQDSYLMKLRRQTLTFTSSRLKEFLAEHQSRRSEGATKHKVLLRTYQTAQAPASSPK